MAGPKCIPGTQDRSSCMVDMCELDETAKYVVTNDNTPYYSREFECHENPETGITNPIEDCTVNFVERGKIPKGTVVADLNPKPSFITLDDNIKYQFVQVCNGGNNFASYSTIVPFRGAPDGGPFALVKPSDLSVKSSDRIWYKPWTWFNGISFI